MSVLNKSALVTGASGAIGGAISEEFLKNGLKYLAALDIHDLEPKILSDWKCAYPNAVIKYFQVDVTSKEKLKQCYDEFLKMIPSLDIVVNSAGIFNEGDPSRVVNVNLYGVIESTRLAIEHMKIGVGKGGTVINISSHAGLIGLSSCPAYVASKIGVIGYTRAVAFGREELGIKFLTLCPTVTNSELYENAFQPGHLFMASEKSIALAKELISQSPVDVAKATMNIMLNAKNGSVWVLRMGQLSEATQNAIAINF
ncbi:fat body protein 2-like [Phlebotomus papatasi]|uniref:fat body protein 2-like n=1 Tax=Phlebotomus papatasi TaxID=29031 RepID=UPI0024838184|nr:fat body protein 2-like [Phlebotomus papatasi]